ncbi:MAG: superoxide dismutase [Deltaproteobacteria bacterium]|nr:MAG: superoxide dismutase [Deltaproteobacteria bacterium]
MNRTVTALSVALAAATMCGRAHAHCEIPCGIYDDGARFNRLEEHISTIEKSMRQIAKLSRAPRPDYNQIVRWVTNKEHHAEQFQHILSQYFLHQRIKPVENEKSAAYKEYIRKLVLVHKLLVAAMKTKQSTDLTVVTQMRSLLGEFRKAYEKK